MYQLQVARTRGPQIDELKAMLAYVVIQPNFNVKRYRYELSYIF